MQVVLAASSLAVILLHEFLWVIWIVTCAALALVVAWPAITELMHKRAKKRARDTTVASPRVPAESSSMLGRGGHQVHVDAGLGGGASSTADNHTPRSTQYRAQQTYSDQV